MSAPDTAQAPMPVLAAGATPPPSAPGAPPQQSMRRPGVLDRTALVWQEDAFTGFAPSADYKRVRDLVAHPTPGGAWPDRGVGGNPLLPGLQCGAPHPDQADGRCGLTLVPMRTDDATGYAYTSARCSLADRGHRASVLPYVERPVLEMIAEAYAPAAMEGAVRAVRARSDATARDLAALDRALAAREADYGRASALEREAYREDRPLDVEHWAAERRLAQEARRALQQERAALVQAAADLSPAGGLDQQLRLVREVVRHVGTLLARSRAHAGMTAGLVRILTRSITHRQVAPSVAVIEVEFPNGARAARVVLTGKASSTQPERVLAYHAVASGADLAATVGRLTQATDRYGPRLLLTPDKVRALALHHRFFETVPPPAGPLESVTALAARLKVDVSAYDVEQAALAGALGAVGVAADGTLLLAPSEAQLEGSLDAYGAARVEQRERWAAGEAIRMRTLRPDYGVSAEAVARAVRDDRPGRYGHDLAGRRYVRRSAIPARLWARGAERAGGPAAFRAAARAAIDAAGYAATALEDWWLAGDLITTLRTRARVGSGPGLRNARAEGRVLDIRYRGPNPVPGNRRPDVLIYCPADVAHSGDPARVRAWYRGETPRPTPDRPRSDPTAAAPAPRARAPRRASSG